MDKEPLRPGLGTEPESSWPTMTQTQRAAKPLELLRPGSLTHQRVLSYLVERLEHSEREMARFYDRWRYNERRLQAYISLSDAEQALKALNDRGEPAKVVSIQVPYSYATISTIVTYLVHAFLGRKPIFQVGSYKSETTESAHKLETLLQYNSDHIRLARHLFQYFKDGETYGVAVLKCYWMTQKSMRTTWIEKPRVGFFNLNLGGEKVKQRMLKTTFAGNFVESVDPFMFFPDPRVPMSEVNRRGEYVFWRQYEGKHLLMRLEAEGKLRWVNSASEKMPMPARGGEGSPSDRSLMALGMSHPGSQLDSTTSLPKNFMQVDQGTCMIVPAELGLGESRLPQRWMFTILNKSQIVQAEPFDVDHGMHPVAVVEPYTLGYGFGHPAIADYLGPLQDTISWFINSHIHNVRTAINNMWLVDPSRVEMQDLKNPEAGKIIRLKRAAYGQDVREILTQLQVSDVTRGHVNDVQLMYRMADMLAGVNDNLRGLQDSSGRKTATEVRTSAEAGASRLAAHSRIYSAQGITDLTEMMAVNTQQFMDEEMALNVLGMDGARTPIIISPEHVVGDFFYPIHDGTLPLDRVAMLDVWKEIFLAAVQVPQLAGRLDLMEMFKYMAELGGASNLDKFELQVQPQLTPDGQVMEQAAQGNVVPLSDVTQRSGQINAAPTQPRGRL